MTYFVGRRTDVGIARETTRGTPVSPAFWIPASSNTFDNKAVVVDSEGAFGNVADSHEGWVTKRFAEGDIEFDIYDKAFGLILTALAGAAPTSTGTTNYTHTYTLQNTNQHTSLSLYIKDPNGYTMYPLAMLNRLEITIEPEGIVKATAGFRSREGQDWQNISAVYTSLGEKYLHQHLGFKLAADIAGLSGASNIDLRALTLTVEKNIADWDDMGTAVAADILNKQFSVTGSITLGFNDRTYRNYMLLNTYRACEITLTQGTNNVLTIQMPRLSFRGWEPNRSLDDIATEAIEFKAMYDLTNSLAQISTLTLTNQQASY